MLPIDPVHVGQLMSGFGNLLWGLASAATALGLYKNRTGIMMWFQTRHNLMTRADTAEARALSSEARAVAAEQRALNWERGAQGAAFNAEEVMRRLDEVEGRAKKAEALIPKFDALLTFTKRLLTHTNSLEKQLKRAGVKYDTAAPEIPAILKEQLEEDV